MCLAWIVTGLNRDWPESWLAWIVSGLSGVWPESCLFGLNRAYWAWIEMDLNRTGLNRDWPESCPAWVVGPESCQAWIVHFWPESRWAWIVTGLNRDRPESCLAWVVRPESFGLNRAGLNRRAWIKCESHNTSDKYFFLYCSLSIQLLRTSVLLSCSSSFQLLMTVYMYVCVLSSLFLEAAAALY